MGDDIATCRFSALLVFWSAAWWVVAIRPAPRRAPRTPVLTSASPGGLNPTITWAAECGAEEVAVFSPVTGFPVWHLTAGTRRIPNPVTYGVVPSGTKVLHTAESL